VLLTTVAPLSGDVAASVGAGISSARAAQDRRLGLAYALDVLVRDLLRESTRNPDGELGQRSAAAWRARCGGSGADVDGG